MYTLYGLTETPAAVPTSLYPMPMSKYDSGTHPPKTPRPRKSHADREQAVDSPRGGASKGKDEKGQTGKKTRKKRPSKGKDLNSDLTLYSTKSL